MHITFGEGWPFYWLPKWNPADLEFCSVLFHRLPPTHYSLYHISCPSLLTPSYPPLTSYPLFCAINPYRNPHGPSFLATGLYPLTLALQPGMLHYSNCKWSLTLPILTVFSSLPLALSLQPYLDLPHSPLLAFQPSTPPCPPGPDYPRPSHL